MHDAYYGLPIVLPWNVYGWLIYCTEEEYLDSTHPELNAILRFAREQHGCDWVRFDCDAYELEGFPVFDW